MKKLVVQYQENEKIENTYRNVGTWHQYKVIVIHETGLL